MKFDDDMQFEGTLEPRQSKESIKKINLTSLGNKFVRMQSNKMILNKN